MASAGFLFFRLDITQEKKYTLAPSTNTLLGELPDIVYIKLYLDGDLPASYLKLQKEIREMINEFRMVAGDNVQYEIINPSEHSNDKAKYDFYRQLAKKGVLPVSISENEQEGVSQKILFPGAILSYRGKEVPVNFLKSRMGAGTDEIVNASVETIEYELSNGIRKLTRTEKEKIAFLEGQGEFTEPWVRDITQGLGEYYQVEHVRINHKLNALAPYRALVIARPDSAFDDKDKFIIDQFIMRGGKVLWLVDGVTADMDSLQSKPVMYGISKELNLDDMLFRYGARILPNLVMDMQSAPIPMITGMLGNQPQRSLLNWNYFPLVTPREKHPIVRNLNPIRFQFASSLDTIPVSGIKKSVLLSSSEYTRIQQTPARISLEILRAKENPSQYAHSPVILAVLLEGTFPSIFKNRISAAVAEDSAIAFKESSVPGKMIVVSDGDVIRNQVSKSTGESFPLGYDRFSGMTFGNRNFLLNCMNYLLDEEGLISLRSREIKLRVLDKNRVNRNKQTLRILNLLLPIGLVCITGILLLFLRKRRYARS